MRRLLCLIGVVGLLAGCAAHQRRSSATSSKAGETGHQVGTALRTAGKAAAEVGREIGHGFKSFSKGVAKELRSED